MARTPESPERVLEALVCDHLPMARDLAFRFRGRGVELEDLEQVASLALVKAAHGYDAERGPFPPYAAATVRGELKKYFRDHAWSIRPPRRLQDLQAAIAAAMDDQPDVVAIADLAHSLSVEPELVLEAIVARGCFAPDSTDRVLSGQSEVTLGETLRVADLGLELIDDWITFCRMFRALSPDERQLLTLRFVDDLTQQEVATHLGISQMHVSRRLSRLLGDLREKAARGDATTSV